jgi:dephospho-CoA kinase
MFIVGLTGNIASGKSSVARLFAAWGAPVIDADVLAREAVAPGSEGLHAIAARWGKGVLAADGSLDRAALRRIVFADSSERAALDAIVHPEVGRRRSGALAAARARGERLVICDIPLLFEAHLAGIVDGIVLVDAPSDVRLARLMHDRQLTAAEASAMMDAQWPAEPKRAKADWVIDNDGSPADLETRARSVFEALRARAASA